MAPLALAWGLGRGGGLTGGEVDIRRVGEACSVGVDGDEGRVRPVSDSEVGNDRGHIGGQCRGRSWDLARDVGTPGAAGAEAGAGIEDSARVERVVATPRGGIEVTGDVDDDVDVADDIEHHMRRADGVRE